MYICSVREKSCQNEAMTELHSLVRSDILALFLVFQFCGVEHFSGPLINVWFEMLEVYVYKFMCSFFAFPSYLLYIYIYIFFFWYLHLPFLA